MLRFSRRAEKYQIEGLPDWMASLLHARGVHDRETAEKFLQPDLSHLHDPFDLNNMQKAVDIISAAAKGKKRAVVWGDYDVDGMCATSLLYETLQAMRIPVITFIPDRHTDGYGLSFDGVEKLASQADLLITVDCGITAQAEVQRGKELGMTVIITDHHALPEMLPEADAIISPLLNNYPFPHLCGAGVAWKLSQALKGLEYARKQLDLAALATIADMVPLTGENRVIAALGLKTLGDTKRAGLVALKEAADIAHHHPLTSEQVAFQLAPRLNASGRLSTAQGAIELLNAANPAHAVPLAQELNTLNTRRKQEERLVLEAAEKQLEKADLLHDRTIVVVGEEWNAGVVGLAAGRLAEKYGYPAVVLSQSGDMCVGSARSAGEVDLYAALKACEDLFERFGGHTKAAGLTILGANVDAFKLRFNEAVYAQLPGGELIPTAEYDDEMPLSLVTPETSEALMRLAPFGVGNPAPVFLKREAKVLSARCVGADMRHLKMTLGEDDVIRDAIAFGCGEEFGGLSGSVDVLFVPQKNEFRGRLSGQCLVKNIVISSGVFKEDAALERRIILQELQAALLNSVSYPVNNLSPESLQIAGSQGTLLLCRTAKTAMRLKEQFPWMDAAIHRINDPRAFQTVLHNARLKDINAPYEKLVFADGLIHPSEAGLAHTHLPKATLYAFPISDTLSTRIEELAVTQDELREAYIALKKQTGLSAFPWTDEKRTAALVMLSELSLIQGEGSGICMLPLRKCDPQESPLYRVLST